MTVTDSEFPQCRPVPQELTSYSCLTAAWNRTRETLNSIRHAFEVSPLPDEIVTIYVCGSLGRMEQLENSDCDLVIVTDDSVPPDSKRGAEIYSLVWERIEPLDLHRPKPNGIFSQTVTRGQLTDRATLGLVDEDQFVFGKRIQLLLDSQPVYRDDGFESLTRDVLDRYRLPHAGLLQTSVWSGLQSELIRYFRALCVRTMWLPVDTPGTWRVLNVKLRHSRLVLFAGLMSLLQAADETMQLDGLKRTPLERIGAMCERGEADEILHAYDIFLQKMNDPAITAQLAETTIPIEASGHAFHELIDNSRALSVALSRLSVFRNSEFIREMLFG